MNNVLIDINHLTKVFKRSTKPALNNISLTIPQGQLIGLIGPDGSGKTTLIRLIAGLLRPTEGSISIRGLDTLTDMESIRTFMGYMPQKFGLYEDLTVMQNLNLYADIKGTPKHDKASQFDYLLELTGLQRFTGRLAGNLSGGMKQKLGLCCSLLSNPSLLLLDEPSVGVDPISRHNLWQMVNKLLKNNLTVIWSTSYLDEADQCDQVLLMNEGQLLYYGIPQHLTNPMKGRVYKIRDIDKNKRETLRKVLDDPEIIDGLIQGASLRVVLKKDSSLTSLSENIKHLSFEAEEPRFEDAFVDKLERISQGESFLAKAMPQIEAKSENIIQVNQLTKKFGDFKAIDNISFDVKYGEIFGLLGPNGAGKSTTFKILCGLLKTTDGLATILGQDFKESSGKIRARIGYMAQTFSLYENLTVLQNLQFFAGLYNLSRSRKKIAIENVINSFGFAPHLNEAAGLLPLGFKQRLSLSCCTMHSPEILFLDEPTSGVDPITRREFWNHINGLVSKGVTIVVTTHFMEEAEYCDRIALMYNSKIILLDTPEAIKKQAQSPNNPSPSFEEAFIHLIKQYDTYEGTTKL